MNMPVRPYASRGFFRVGVILFILACLSAQGCGKVVVSGSDGGRSGVRSGAAVVATAKTQIGRAYKYGGISPKTGFDCSGLIAWSYQQHGIKVPRHSADQAKTGQAVKKSQLSPGDIVVFRISSRSGLHTGLYSGNGKFVHSPSAGKRIREDKIDDNYWKRRYVSARRVLF